MPRLPSINCSKCEQPVPERESGEVGTASTFEDCLRACPPCGLAWSNANTDDRSKLTTFDRNPLSFAEDIAPYISEGYEWVLANAFNIHNRTNKRRKFEMSTSEDQVTWVVFRYLQHCDMLSETLGHLGIKGFSGSVRPTILLWGVPLPQVGATLDSRDRLVEVSNALGELRSSRSEPDVIVDAGPAGLLFIEVKLRSPNDHKSSGYEHWGKYESRDSHADWDGIKDGGLYELARNWRIGLDMAGGRPFTLMNLLPEKTSSKELNEIDVFKSQLATLENQHEFGRKSWEDFLSAVPYVAPWLRSYLAERKLDIPNGAK